MMKNSIKKEISFFLVVILIFISINLGEANDVYKPYLHNPIVPKNPGLGILGSYETDLWTGAATYTYPIDVPPGTNGLAPTLSVSYNHQLTSNSPGILGTAWTLNENYIYRDVNYSFSNTSDDKFKLVLNGQAYELIYDSSDQKYHTKIESYLYIKNFTGGNNTNNLYWIVKDVDGNTYRFGYNSDSELVSNLFTYTVRWSLDLITDTYNNKIYYSYKENPYGNDSGAVYPYRIEYNNDKKRVIEFIPENTNRPDLWKTYEQGNKISYSRRIKEINITADSKLVRKYILNYTTLNSESKSFLSSITVFGNDEIISLPSVIFEYYNISKGWQEDETLKLPSAYVTFEAAGSDYGVRLLDFNRDGFVDLTRADGLNPQFNQTWINNGSGWVRNDSWNVPKLIVDDDQYDSGIRFIDFDGDGFTDIVWGDGSSRKSYRNLGNGWSSDNSTWHLPTNANPISSGSGIYERGVSFADINGDGLPDILSATDDWNYAWINNGSGWSQDNSWKVPSSARFVIYPAGTDEGVRLADINGDGLPDLIKGKGSSGRDAWINNGSGWVEDPAWDIPSDAYFVDESTGEDKGVRLADINGDGLVDIIKSGANRYEQTWINNGSGWVEDPAWNVPERTAFIYGTSGHNKGVRLVDINGDGLVDLMNGGDREITFVNKATKPYFLKRITNNLGGFNVVDYSKSTSFDNSGSDNISDLGFNLWIVTASKENNSITGKQALFSETDYSYENGYYDYADRQFRGFGKVDSIQQGILMTSHWFYQNDSLKGKEYKIELLDSNSNPFSKSEYVWNVSSENNYYVLGISKQIDYLYDGAYDLPKITEKSYSYDNYGNIKEINYSGDNSSLGDEKYEYFEYVYNTTSWIVNGIKNYTLVDSNGLISRNTLYYYDKLNYGQAPTKGSLTNRKDWLNGGVSPITNYSYDSYGNLVNETDAKGYVTKYVYGLRDTTNTFIDQVINAKGHIFNYNYDLGTGNILWKVDPNGFSTNYTYDTFGRIKKEILPYDTESYPTKEYNYTTNGSAPEIIKVSERENNGSTETLDSYYFYDGLGNLIQTKTESEDDSKQIVKDFYYDSVKRVVNQSNPYLTAVSFGYSTPNESVSMTDYFYDSLSRTIKVKNPDGTIKNITFNHWEITEYDENNNKKTYFLNAYGQIETIIDYSVDNYFETNYDYDVSGNVISITDPYDNVINYTYDSLGRKVQEDNADSGTWKYYYDSIGDLVKQTDNRSVNITLDYDELGRLVAKITSDETINYSYDQVNGTLWKVTSPVLTTIYSYDQRLRKVQETNVIDEKNFTARWSYDSLDRIKSETLPDGDGVIYNYTTQGQVNSIVGVLDEIQYNEANLPTILSYNNNLNTTYTYSNTTFRIEKIKTDGDQELDYEYDSRGNIISIIDNVNNFIISMVYDGLNRLVHSKKSNQSSFEFNYTYDFIGNILKIEGTKNINYFYNLYPKHAPCLITTTEITNNSFPSIAFVLPTPLNSSNQSGNSIYVNVTASDINKGNDNISTFIDFDNSLVGWWRMDDTNGSANSVSDYMGRNNGTALGNAVQTSAGKLGKGYSFDGVNSSIKINSFNLTNEGSVSLWFYANNLTGNSQHILYKKNDNSTSLRFYRNPGWSSGGLGWLLYYQNQTGGISNALPISYYNTNQWYQVVFAYNSSGYYWVYINGINNSNSQSPNFQNWLVGNGEMYFGSTASSSYFNGTIDDIIIFNRSLSAEEIRGLYANQSSKYLEVNFTNLNTGAHTFKAYAQDTAGNVNATEKRIVSII